MNESQIIEVASADWQGQQLSVPREALLAGVERGKVLYFPHLAFAIEGGERALLDPKVADPKRKNISLAPNGGALVGVLGDAVTQSAVRALIARYQANARSLVDGLFPEYRRQVAGRADQPAAASGGNARDVVAQGRQPPARRCLPVAAELWRAHPARVHQRQSGWRAARVARRRAVRGHGKTLPARHQSRRFPARRGS